MNDAAWLPSAIMQTTGALMGIYVVVYIFAFSNPTQRNLYYTKKREKQLVWINWPFYAIFFLGTLTILSNYLWLASITEVPVFKKTPYNIFLINNASNFFVLTLTYILAFTIMIIHFINKLRKVSASRRKKRSH
jgi:hypothetical protein